MWKDKLNELMTGKDPVYIYFEGQSQKEIIGNILEVHDDFITFKQLTAPFLNYLLFIPIIKILAIGLRNQ